MPCGRPWEQPCGRAGAGRWGQGGLCRRSAEHPLRVPGHLDLPPPPAPPNVPRTGPPAPPCRGGPEAQAGDPARRPFPDRPLDTPPARPTSLVGKPRPGAEGVPGGAGGGRAESGSLPAAPHAQLEAPSANVNGGVAWTSDPAPRPGRRGSDGRGHSAAVRLDRGWIGLRGGLLSPPGRAHDSAASAAPSAQTRALGRLSAPSSPFLGTVPPATVMPASLKPRPASASSQKPTLTPCRTTNPALGRHTPGRQHKSSSPMGPSRGKDLASLPPPTPLRGQYRSGRLLKGHGTQK